MSRRFRRRPPRWLYLAAGLIAVIAIRWATDRPPQTPKLQPGAAVVRGIRDERTLLVSQGQEEQIPVRLMGIIASQKDASANSAQQWLRENLLDQQVHLEFDHRRLDRDGVPLAYVHLGATLVNAELIRHGWAVPEYYPGDSASRGKQLRDAVSNR